MVARSWGYEVFQLQAIKKCTYTDQSKEITMQWTKPEFTDLRFGFEITMYIANR